MRQHGRNKILYTVFPALLAGFFAAAGAAAFPVSVLAAVSGTQEIGPGVDMAEKDTGSGPGQAESDMEAYYRVRFAADGLSLYGSPDDTGEPLAVLSDGARVVVTGGPDGSYVKVRTAESGEEGYVKFAYLWSEDAVVDDTDGLYTYEDMETDILGLMERYPDLVQAKVNGLTADGRSLYQLTVGDMSSQQAKKQILIHAGIHAREYANCRLVMEQLETALEFWDSGAYHGKTYAELFSGVEFQLVPMVNPDGTAISQLGESGIRTEAVRETVRKCYQDDQARGRATDDYTVYLGQWKANGRGVDLNKNFPTGLGVGYNPGGPSFASYPGNANAQEAESANLTALAEEYNPYVTINYHSMGQVIYWDINESLYRERNRTFASYMAELTGYQMMPAASSTGGFLDWQLLRSTPSYTVTLETGSAACPMPASEYANVWLANYLVWPAAAEFAAMY